MPRLYRGGITPIGIANAYSSGRNQAAWFIDPINGSDSNNGKTTGTALKTWLRMQQLCGGENGIIVPLVATTVTIMNSTVGNTNEYINCQVAPAAFSFIVTGTPTAQFSGAATAKTDLSEGTSTFNQMTAGWTVATELNRLVKDVTTGQFAWVAKDLGAGAARLSPWTTIDQVNGGITTTTGNASGATDSITTFTLPAVQGRFTCWNTGIASGQGTLIVNNLDLQGTTTQRSGLTTLNAQVCYQNCSFTQNNSFHSGGATYLNNCRINNLHFGNDNALYCTANAGLVTGAPIVQPHCRVSLRSDILTQGVQWTVVNSELNLSAASFADTANPITTLQAAQINLTTAWGSGNTGNGVVFKRGSRGIVSASAANLTLTGNTASVDFSVGGNTTAFPFDTATHAYLTAVNCSWTLLTTATGSGGFGSRLFDPASGVLVVVDA